MFTFTPLFVVTLEGALCVYILRNFGGHLFEVRCLFFLKLLKYRGFEGEGVFFPFS